MTPLLDSINLLEQLTDGEGNGNPFQNSCLGVPWTEEPGGLLSIGSPRVGHNWRDSACMHALEKEMATHSSILAWRIPGTEEPGGLRSMWSHRVRHDWSNLAAAAAAHRTQEAHLLTKLPVNCKIIKDINQQPDEETYMASSWTKELLSPWSLGLAGWQVEAFWFPNTEALQISSFGVFTEGIINTGMTDWTTDHNSTSSLSPLPSPDGNEKFSLTWLVFLAPSPHPKLTSIT